MKKTTKRCPLIKKPCIEHDCVYYRPIQLVDKSNMPFKLIEQWNCTTINQELYLRDISQASYEHGAAIESLRNEVVKESKISRQAVQQNHSENIQKNIALTYNGSPHLEYRTIPASKILPK